MDVNPGETTVSQIDEVVRAAGVERSDLSAIAVGVGPGPYTSTRIGVAIASTLAFALDLPIYGVCTHDAIALGFATERDQRRADRGSPALDGRSSAHTPSSDFIVATDARRREIYWARYDSEGTRVDGPTVGKPDVVVAGSAIKTWVGNGFERYPELVEQEQLTVVHQPGADARWIGAIALAAISGDDAAIEKSAGSRASLVDHDSEQAAEIPTTQRIFAPYPMYLRRPDAKLPGGSS